MYIYIVFSLKHYLEHTFETKHYPMDIISQIVLKIYGFTRIILGEDYTCFITDNIYVCGKNTSGKLGLNSSNKCIYRLTKIDLDNVNPQHIEHIHFATNKITYLTKTGDVYEIQNMLFGKFGAPRKLMHNIKQIAHGSIHTVMVTKSNEIYSLGRNDCGQLGFISESRLDDPVKINLPNVKSVACGEKHTVAITNYGEIYVWGKNKLGQLGLGDTANRYEPTKLFIEPIAMVGCGDNFTVVLSRSGKLFSWGLNTDGQLGLSNMNNQCVPKEILFTDGQNIKSVNCGAVHAFILMNNGDVWGWGCYKRLGFYINKSTIKSPLDKNFYPYRIDVQKVISIKCGKFHTCAITVHNEICMWGSNTNGQQGLNDCYERHDICIFKDDRIVLLPDTGQF